MSATFTAEEVQPLDGLLVGLIPAAGNVEVRHGDTLIASSGRAVELHEIDVPTRLYFPREDVSLDRLRPIVKSTSCPFKGVADEYWALADDPEDTPVAWSYPEPTPAFDGIAGYIAFYDSLTHIFD
jgi:uncharacterized protein (DUF427 family)